MHIYMQNFSFTSDVYNFFNTEKNNKMLKYNINKLITLIVVIVSIPGCSLPNGL